MSIHPSLSGSGKHKKQRSILKRSERLKIMLKKGNWNEGDNVFGLPKIKTIRIKIKKEKAAKEEVAVATADTIAATEAKEQTLTKGSTAKAPETKK